MIGFSNGGMLTYRFGVRVVDEASVESRDLVVQYIKGTSPSAIARFWWKAGLGLDTRMQELEALRADDFTIDCVPRQYVSIDGEPVTRTPVRARVARQALLLRVPRDQQTIR